MPAKPPCAWPPPTTMVPSAIATRGMSHFKAGETEPSKVVAETWWDNKHGHWFGVYSSSVFFFTKHHFNCIKKGNKKQYFLKFRGWCCLKTLQFFFLSCFLCVKLWCLPQMVGCLQANKYTVCTGNVQQMAARNWDIKTDAMPPFYLLHVTHVQYQANPASTF